MAEGRNTTDGPSGNATIDLRQLADLVRAGNEERATELARVAERLVKTFAGEFMHRSGTGDIEIVATRLADTLAERLDQRSGMSQENERRIRAYQWLRGTLAGPVDDEASTVDNGVVVSVKPPSARVGDTITILLRRAGRAAQVEFAAEGDAETVTATPTSTSRDRADLASPGVSELVRVVVPEGAISGPLTVVTDTGVPTSAFDFVVTTADPFTSPEDFFRAPTVGRR